MRKILLLSLSVFLLWASVAWAAPNEINVFIWSEYIDPEIPVDFEKATGIKVRMDLYESNEEMLAKLQAGGVSQYDIIVPSTYIITPLIKLDLLMKLDKSKLPNLKNLDPNFISQDFDKDNEYCVPYQWGTVGLMYRKDKITNYQNTWAFLFDTANDPGPFALIDSSREMIGIVLVYLGYEFNSTNPKELKEAIDLLAATKQRSNCLGFKGGVGGKNDVVAGVAYSAIVYNGDALRAVEEDPENMDYIIPMEGSEIWMDSMCIPAKAPNPDGAHAWINYILDPEVGAKLSNWNQYATPNLAAKEFITPEDLKNPAIYPSAEMMKRLFYVEDLGKENRIIEEAWTRVKSH